MTGPHLVGATGVKGERSESAGREARLTAETETKHSKTGEAETKEPNDLGGSHLPTERR